jgi:hypothetical protein
MKATVEGVSVDGEPEEIARLIRALKSRPAGKSGATISDLDRFYDPPRLSPPLDDLCEYIRSKPNYAHTTDELRRKFYHGKIDSRDRNYTFFYHRTQSARERIAREEHGNFIHEGETYKFRKS